MALPLWLPQYSKEYGELDPVIYQGLFVMSASTGFTALPVWAGYAVKPKILLIFS